MTAAELPEVEIDPGELTPEGALVTDPRPTDRRHPVEVTSGRIADHVEQFGRYLTPADHDQLADTIEVLAALHARLDRARRRGDRDA